MFTSVSLYLDNIKGFVVKKEQRNIITNFTVKTHAYLHSTGEYRYL